MPQITPNFLFNSEALDAAEFYTKIFPNSTINSLSHYGEAGPLPAGTVLTVDFVLDGQDYTAINCGESFAFNASLSFRVICHGQEEVDHYWYALSDGGSEGQCGWLEDRFGVSWQVTPVEMGMYLGNPDPAKAGRAMKAMLQMKKIDLAQFQDAVDSES
jgi:predicted 3-demethylubiquinone-9 3-methyltransferase (glyoxalase superfamily)